MESKQKLIISVSASVHAPIDKIWKYWTTHEDIIKWSGILGDWHMPFGKNDLRVGGEFTYRVETKDESVGFNFRGVYDAIEKNKLIEYTINDGRRVRVIFNTNGDETEIVETFEAEDTHPEDLQREGWQDALACFKKYAEAH